MTNDLADCYRPAIAAIEAGSPRPLERRALLEADDRSFAGDASIAALVQYLQRSSLNDPLRMQLHLGVARWDDAAASESWTEGTDPQCQERRNLVWTLLGVPVDHWPVLDQLFLRATDGPVVISDLFEPWYSAERQNRRPFYWPAYATYLAEKNGWKPELIRDLDRATTAVIERLSNPERDEAYQSKGLVVGYVQSGKTANFTGVLAKAIDAGYRLIIVMTGTVDLLRTQTQRRLDMELVGKENILRGVDPSDPDLLRDIDYLQDDDAWDGRFIEHGALPSTLNFPDVIRLTTHRFDYKSLKAGIVALEFEKVDKSRPLYDPINLPTSRARLVIVKKNKAVLQKLTNDLKSIQNRLGEIPALIIDDESDEASVNTTNPDDWKADTPERLERTAINRLISDLLGQLPRAQYIGYTATPFANVFVDPSDAENIFPKDFLISLERPPGYMGVSDFHDLDPALEGVEKTIENSNERRHVRSVVGQGAARLAELRSAIDAFVLTGAIKLYREAHTEGLTFRHHTMLVHESVKQIDHATLAEDIEDLWRTGGYHSSSGLDRLALLYAEDFAPICAVRADGDLPERFEDLHRHIAATVGRITEHGKPTIIVNGNKDLSNEDIAFDTRRVWRILVGGTKLSRGFTVEGLTISYYRRKARHAATLMQMGRWFGFRRGYADLVRLYIGRAEPDGAKTLDLYEAFEGIVRDEEAFRLQLKQYSQLVDGRPLVTPREIPPLVSQHLPWLSPTAKNKMFNAKLVTRRTAGSLVIPTGYPKTSGDRANNFSAVLPLMQAASTLANFVVPAMPNVRRGLFAGWYGMVKHPDFVAALRGLSWITADYYQPEIAFVAELEGRVQDWLVIMPQLDTAANTRCLASVGDRSVFKRGPKPPHFNLWGEPTDRKHRPAALRVAGAYDPYADNLIESLVSPTRGAVLVYPMNEQPETLHNDVDGSDVMVGVAWVVPTSCAVGGSQVLQFVTRNAKDERAAIIDV